MNYCQESSEDKQKRVGCNFWRGLGYWDCYTDCAFWNGEKCTYREEG